MADFVVLVNGLPGAGKSTLAAQLAPLLGVPLIAKDAIKEALAGALPDVPTGTLGPVAAQTMWTMAAALTGGALLESWWFRPRDQQFAAAGLQRSGAATVVEIWCDVPPETARARFVERRRDPLHRDEHHLAKSWPAWAAAAEPLALGAVIPVRTDREVDLPGLAERVAAELKPTWPGVAAEPKPTWPDMATELTPTRHAGVVARPPAPLPNASGSPWKRAAGRKGFR